MSHLIYAFFFKSHAIQRLRQMPFPSCPTQRAQAQIFYKNKGDCNPKVNFLQTASMDLNRPLFYTNLYQIGLGMIWPTSIAKFVQLLAGLSFLCRSLVQWIQDSYISAPPICNIRTAIEQFYHKVIQKVIKKMHFEISKDEGVFLECSLPPNCPFQKDPQLPEFTSVAGLAHLDWEYA